MQNQVVMPRAESSVSVGTGASDEIEDEASYYMSKERCVVWRLGTNNFGML